MKALNVLFHRTFSIHFIDCSILPDKVDTLTIRARLRGYHLRSSQALPPSPEICRFRPNNVSAATLPSHRSHTLADHFRPCLTTSKAGPTGGHTPNDFIRFWSDGGPSTQDLKFPVHTTVRADVRILFRTGGKSKYGRGEMGSREVTFVL
jgi:hypothetical protein